MSKRALVVEDDVNIAELLRLYLGKDGFDVMIAPDGGKAGSMFDLFQPDVVLLDIMYLVKDGWQVCREIRKKSSTPIIMLSARGEEYDAALSWMYLNELNENVLPQDFSKLSKKDLERDKFLEDNGIAVIRFTNKRINENFEEVCSEIWEFMAIRR